MPEMPSRKVCNDYALHVELESAICKEIDNHRCSSYVCIHRNQVCDGKKDCEDGSDENNCESAACKEKDNHRCTSYVCIHKHQVCDGKKDCEDGSDEEGCESAACKEEDHHRCTSYVCIHKNQVCDGKKDCEDGSDEEGCESDVCKETLHFRCSSYVCIYLDQVCDGVKDCEDGSDEKGCESAICKEIDHFRCSSYVCIRKEQVCDGKRDCGDGSDESGCETGVVALKKKGSTIKHLLARLRRHRDPSYSWGKNTARAITTLYLSGNASFRGDNMDEELMAKELELQMSVALLRNYTEMMSVNELSMFINALSVTCYDPRRFFGNDLLQILAGRLSLSSPIPGPYLTLCSSGWTLHKNATQSLLHLLQTESRFPYATDLQAITVMALTCIKHRTHHFQQISHAAKLYNSIIHKFIGHQNSDGSFGNPQTTAWITQALIASGQESNKEWNLNATVKYLKHELNSSENFLLTYLALPILNGKSLLDIGNVNCSGVDRQHEDDMDDLTQKLKGNLEIQYSLFLGDNKNVIHTMHLRMPDHSSVYEVMKVAQMTDKKYSFLSKNVSGYRYVYEVSGVPNDPEAGMFWLLYKKSVDEDDVVQISESPDKITVEDKDHLILWYKTSFI